jgi:hypothetical protein
MKPDRKKTVMYCHITAVMIWSVILQPSAFLASAGQERIGAE